MIQPSNAIVMITDECNLKCKYCFEKHKATKMDWDTCKATIDFLNGNNPDKSHICFFGGEPMLEFNNLIVPSVEYAKKNNLKTTFGMTTNGTLLDNNKVDFLIDNGINFMLSMDGFKEIQDENRVMKNGQSSFDVIVNNIPYILEKYPYITVRSTLSPNKLGDLFNIITFFESIGFKNIAILPDLFSVWNQEQVSSFTEAVKAYEESLIVRYERGEKPRVFSGMVNAFSRLWALSKVTERRQTIHCKRNCQCGFGCMSSVSITTDGKIYGCHHPDIYDSSIWLLGDIYTGVNEDKVNHLISLYNPLLLGNEECENCPLDMVCNGGCKPNNYVLFKDLNKVPKSYCYWNRILTDSAYRILTRLKNKNTQFDNDFERFKYAEKY